ncbi:MAG: hypothetical protein JW891_03800 [Candidatus Lokiarchaeota archaeon]|nr:hypothetical protein [Candidatus Lokiarchaeota archaeon]
MPTRYNYCPHCNKQIVFKIELEDIDTSLYPAPFYLYHKNDECNKVSTFYVDSLLRVSYTELEKKKSKTGGIIKTIETIK